ncbi:MAG: threonylcarbamoyl-AMP synthase [Burkholderiaceae bacterium]|nr:threonylcarbamoyl-AMP synthase [Microbacteriaceae bacterium]
MATIFDCSDSSGLLTGMRLARAALGRGELVVFPTDTVYGIAADAFDPAAVQRLLGAKGRTRQAPPPVLIPGIPTLDALAEEVPPEVRALVATFWPGALTIILPARNSLQWDLGETGGTVALRMPANPYALELLSETGPLAVSSANLSGEPAATTAADAERMLGSSVSVYLDGGESGTDYDTPGTGSTIVDATGLLRAGGELKIVRSGVIPAEAIFAAIAEAAALDTPSGAQSTDPMSDRPTAPLPDPLSQLPTGPGLTDLSAEPGPRP